MLAAMSDGRRTKPKRDLERENIQDMMIERSNVAHV